MAFCKKSADTWRRTRFGIDMDRALKEENTGLSFQNANYTFEYKQI